jgi:hypothetical protein
MVKRSTRANVEKPTAPKPVRIRLPGFIVEEEIGLGDLVGRVAYSVGVKPCAGCAARAARLNRMLVLSR